MTAWTVIFSATGRRRRATTPRAREYLTQIAADHLIHSWDLAAATGQDTTLDPEIVDAVAAWFADREELYRSVGAIGPRGSRTGDRQTDLLAAFGREAGRTAPD